MLSVVIPTFNEGENLVTCLQALKPVNGIDEVLVVDASDSADSLAVLDQLENGFQRRILSSPLKGRANQMNFGASHAAGDCLLFLHCDTRLPVDTGVMVDDCLQKARWGRFDVELDATGWRFRMIERMMNLRSRVTCLATGDQAIFVKRSFFLQQGGFADMPLMEDIEFSKRNKSVARPGLIATRVKTSARRWQQNGVWRTIFLMWKLRTLYWLGVSPDRLASMYHHAR